MKNTRGAALMQVLLIAVILAGITTMLLRANLSRTTSARKTRRAVTGQMLIESCMAQINALWTVKTAEAFRRDYEGGYLYCGSPSASGACPAAQRMTQYTCNIPVSFSDGTSYTYQVKATMNAARQIEYEVITGNDYL